MKLRRLGKVGEFMLMSRSLLHHHLIQAQQRAADAGEGGVIDGVERGVGGLFAVGEQGFGSSGIEAVMSLRFLKRTLENGELLRGRRTGQYKAESMPQPAVRALAAISHHALGEEASGFQICRVIHEVQRL